MANETLALAIRFAAALALGVILGLERERTKAGEGGFAGVRTFGLIALAGGVRAVFGWRAWSAGKGPLGLALDDDDPGPHRRTQRRPPLGDSGPRRPRRSLIV